jgi:predicted RNA binding protein YcfA (HicA-like mRNA interferase family)
MSSLPSVSGRECRKALAKVGFEFRRQQGSHLILRRLHPYAVISVPDHRELGRGLLKSILREAGLSVEEFRALL